MTDIKIGSGKICTWTKGDEFEIKLDHDSLMKGEKVKIEFSPEISDERTALIEAMGERTVVQIIIRITDELTFANHPNQTKLEVEG